MNENEKEINTKDDRHENIKYIALLALIVAVVVVVVVDGEIEDR